MSDFAGSEKNRPVHRQDTKRQPDYSRRGENKIIFDCEINDGIRGIDIMSGANWL
jgi:hypothetical protein